MLGEQAVVSQKGGLRDELLSLHMESSKHPWVTLHMGVVKAPLDTFPESTITERFSACNQCVASSRER